MATTVCSSNNCFTHAQLAVLLKFLVGGIIVLYFYWRIYTEIFGNKPNDNAMTPQNTWGYLIWFKKVWFPITLVTTTSVVYVFIWLSIVHTDSDYNHHEFIAFVVSGTFIFMFGAIQWPIRVLKNQQRLANAAVWCTATGSVLILMYIILNTNTAVVWAAAIVMTLHHSVVDGLWTLLPVGLSRTKAFRRVSGLLVVCGTLFVPLTVLLSVSPSISDVDHHNARFIAFVLTTILLIIASVLSLSFTIIFFTKMNTNTPDILASFF